MSDDMAEETDSEKQAGKAKAGKPKEVSSEENVITSDEFNALEKKESKKGGLFGMFKKKKPARETFATDTKDKGGGTSLEEMQMNIEKINGKLELIDTFRSSSEERFVKLGEEIGELRSSLMGQEGTVGKMEAGVEKMQDMVKEIEPEKITKERMKIMKLVEENNAKIDVLDKKGNMFGEEIKGYRKEMGRIQDIENLVKLVKDADSLIAKIRDSENSTKRLSSKVEKIFSEIGTRMSKVDEQAKRIDTLDGLVNEAAGSLEGIEIKMKGTALKDDLEKFQKNMKKDLTLFKKNNEDRLDELRDLVDMMVSTMEDLKKGKPVFDDEGQEREREIAKRMEEIEKGGSGRHTEGKGEEVEEAGTEDDEEDGIAIEHPEPEDEDEGEEAPAKEEGKPEPEPREPAKKAVAKGAAKKPVHHHPKPVKVAKGARHVKHAAPKPVKKAMPAPRQGGVEKEEEPAKAAGKEQKPDMHDYLKIRNLMVKCDDSIEKGDTDTAEELYAKIIELYKKITQKTGKTEETDELYEDIMYLYSELKAEIKGG